MIYDITPPITTATRVWPGDTPPSREVLLDMNRGDHLTLSTLRTTVHAGAHADGPNHYGTDARAIDEQPIELYVGPCQVVTVDVDRGGRISADAIHRPIDRERVLFRTDTFDGHEIWNEDFAGIEPALVDALAARGVRLVGIDTPSVDDFASKTLPAHARFLANDVAILEGLALDGVPDGHYELIALPLKLVGFDASPVRAVLRSERR